MKSCLLFSLSASYLIVAADAFFQNAGAGKKASVNSPFAQEAVEIYGNRFSYGRAPRQDNILDSISKFGVPKTDIDGTRILKERENKGRRITDQSEEDVAACFNGLAAVYGDERAIEMVKIFPICMSFDYKVFGETFAIWSEIFGEEETLGELQQRTMHFAKYMLNNFCTR